jgi:GNAT superfamily N-acetyltransferase
MKTVVRTTYLEMRSSTALIPSPAAPGDVHLMRAGIPSPELSRFLYTAVGGAWHWRDRLPWTWARWMEWLARPGLETWVLYQTGTPAGYYELEAQAGGSVEIASFGLLPGFTGRGLGGYLLTQAVLRAWVMRPEVHRVWLHTCTLDHPAALANYRARGFRVFKEVEDEVDLPGPPVGPWPGAERPR